MNMFSTNKKIIIKSMKIYHLITNHLLPASKTAHSSRKSAIKKFFEVCLDATTKLTRAQCYHSALLYEIDTDVCDQETYSFLFPIQAPHKTYAPPSLTDQESYFSEEDIRKCLETL